MAKAIETVEIKATKKKIYDIITDFESYPEFLPETKSVVVDKHKGNHYVVTFTIEVMKSISYTLDMHGKPCDELAWTLVKGDMMKDNSGRWILEEIKKGVTKVSYEVDVDLGLLVPASLTKALVSKDLPRMLKRFKERVEAI